MRRWWAQCAGGVALLATACASGSPAAPDPHEEVRAFLDANRGRYVAAVGQARIWLDALEVDPFALRARGMRGKKHLVEALDAYVLLLEVAPDADRPALLRRARELAAITYEPRYHDMLEIDDKSFKRNATSYLRAAYLMEKLGLDTAGYRGEIRKSEARLGNHMQQRGPNQRLTFKKYYEHFGLEEPFPLEGALDAGHVRKRRPIESFRNVLDVYNLTHEVFIVYEFGEKLDADFFTAEDMAYLRPTLVRLSEIAIEKNDPDLTAELVVCMRYLRFADLPEYPRAIAFLLDAQHPDGKWGNWEAMRQERGDNVDVGLYLHTTMVTVMALNAAFHLPLP